MENKWLRAALPALLIHGSIGTVYAWSVFKQAIAMISGHRWPTWSGLFQLQSYF